MAFLNDIESKHLSNFVLVTIGRIKGGLLGTGTCVLPDNTFENFTETQCNSFAQQQGGEGIFTPYQEPDDWEVRISTQKITFGGHYYKPILLNIPSISESLDIEQRKYKISSVSLSISDYEEDGERFSDTLNTLMNKEVVIYYASQSCSTLDDCYKAGTYIVRSFSQDEDKVTLNCEDLSQDKLHKDLPLNELGDGEEIPDKYKNKPIPMVFGEVEKSPSVVITSIEDSNTAKTIEILFDSSLNTEFVNSSSRIDIYNIDSNSLWIFREDSYFNVRKEPLNDYTTLIETESSNHYEDVNYEEDSLNSKILLEPKFKDTGDADNSVADDLLETDIIRIPNSFAIAQSSITTVEQTYTLENIRNIIYKNMESANFYNDSIDDFFANPLILKPNWKSISDDDVECVRHFSLHSIYENAFSIGFSDGFVSFKIDFDYDYENFGIVHFDIPINNEDMSEDVSCHSNNMFDITTGNANILEDNDILDYEIRDSENNLSGYWSKKSVSPAGYLKYKYTSGGHYAVGAELNISGLGLYQRITFRRVDKNPFFANVIGRQGTTPNSQAIYTEILSELDFDEELISTLNNDIELGKYAFTIDKKINSKKLIEELSQSTPLYPYFKDGEFRVKSIKKAYSYGDSVPIDVNDVIKYKYDRTKIEKVYTRVNVKYHYDYGLKDFTKETGFVTPVQSGLSDGYSTDYFGDDFDQEFVFESKYIRDKNTAFNLAKYLCGLHANQHNIVTLTLPLNYLTLELGDIVRLDDLIQGRKIFGEDYSSISIGDNAYVRNGQNVYKFWFVEQIKKSLDKVEVKLYQLHEFNFVAGVVDIIDEPDVEPEEPEIPTLPNVEYCPLPDYEETLLDADGNPVDWTNTEVNWVANPALCVNEIIEVPPEPVGYCLIGNNAEYGSTEAECLTNGGEWSASPIVLGCTDDEAVNPNSYATHTDNSQCVYPQELLPPEITSPEEDLVIEIGEGESTEGLGENIVPSNSSNFDENSTENITITGTCSSNSINNCYTYPNSANYGLYPDEFFVGGVITNLTTGDSSIIILFSNNGSDNSLRIQSSNIGWSVGDEYEVISNGSNYSSLSVSNNSMFALYGSDNSLTLKLIGEFPSNYYNNGGIILKNNLNSWFDNVITNNPYRLSVDIRAISHDTTSFRFLRFGSTSAYFSISDTWETYEYDFITSGLSNPAILALGQVDSGDMFEIDNFIIRPITEVTEPTVTVSWNKSSNLVQTYDELGFTTAGEYLFVIYGIIENNYTQFYSAEPIIATGQDSYSQVIYLNDTDIPQNTPLSLLVTARSTSTYNGNYLFNPTFGFAQPTTIVERSFSWGELDENIYTVATIVEIIAYLLGEGELTEEQFALADIDGNGDVNITDVVNIIQAILYG